MKKDEIKSVALSMFAANGYSGCSIQDIADKVGINKATLYFYFKSKADIYHSILSEQAKLYVDSIRTSIEANAHQNLEMTFYRITKAFVETSTTDRLLLWKNAMLSIVGNAEDDVWKHSKEIVFEQTKEISVLLHNMLAAKSKTSKDEQDRFICAFHLLIQSVTDWMLLKKSTLRNDSIDLDYLWNSFWNGSQIE